MSVGYSAGAFLGYTMKSGISYEFYRPTDSADTSCAAITGYSAVTTSCARIYSIDSSTGLKTDTAVYQTSFDPRSRNWYQTAKNYSTAAFSSPYHSAFGNVDQISAAYPLFYPDETFLYGVAIVSMDLAYCKCTPNLTTLLRSCLVTLSILFVTLSSPSVLRL